MAEYNKEQLFYLKLNKDFFDQHYIKILETQQNGDKYVLFLVKLMCESISHNGYLRYNECIPYDETMLASITRTDIDVVRSAIKIFQAMDIIEFTPDKTLFIKGVPLLTTTTTKGAEKKAEQRERKMLEIEQKGTNGGHLSTIDKSIEYKYTKNEVNILMPAHACKENTLNPSPIAEYENHENDDIDNSEDADLLSCLDKNAMALLNKAKDDPEFSFKLFKDWFAVSNIKDQPNPSAWFTKMFHNFNDGGVFNVQHQEELEETIKIAKTKWVDTND